MAVKPNMNVKDIDIYKMLWSPKGTTKGIQLLGLLMSRADPSAPQGVPSSVADSCRLAVRARFLPGGKRPVRS